jgi:cysteine-S-conjugate beta-lyase
MGRRDHLRSFDEPPDRTNGDSTKWNKFNRDVIPLWIADMDFAPPPEVQEALAERVAAGVFGYCQPTSCDYQAVVEYVARAYGWLVSEEHVVFTPGLVSAIGLACRALSSTGRQIITATPIYPPFLRAPGHNDCAPLSIPLLYDGGRWLWDLETLDLRIRHCEQKPELLLLCNPHNPVGQAWTRAELARLLDFVLRHDLLVCSDEAHSDLILSGARHVPFASLGNEAERRTITLMSPSKAFNLAGLSCGYAIVPDAGLRRRFFAATGGFLPKVNTFGLAACRAALSQGDAWLEALLTYLRCNADRVVDAITALPGLSIVRPEATFLAWIDVREFCVRHSISEIAGFFEQAGVALSDGADFGSPQHVRLNFGCSRRLLDAALQRITTAVAVRAAH